MTCLSHPRCDELRDLGWTRLRGKARRPYPIRREDILRLPESDRELLTNLEGRR